MQYRKTLIALAIASSTSSTFVFANTVADEEQSVEKINVRGFQHQEDASSILRNGLELKEIARSVQILDNNFIQEVKPKNLQNILAFTSNLTFEGPNDGRQTSFTLRGFPEPPVLVDGFRLSEWGGVTEPEIWGIEQVEVLKGPDSILFGEANPGGLINMRAKRAGKNIGSQVAVEAGNYGYVSPRVDLATSINDTTHVRLLGLHSSDETFRDYAIDKKRVFLAPSIKFEATENLTFTLFAEHTEDDMPADFGGVLDAEAGEMLGPISQPNNGRYDSMKRHVRNYGVDTEYNLNENWFLSARIRHMEAGFKYSALWLPYSYFPESDEVMRVAANQNQRTKEDAIQLSASGDFDLGSLRNRLVVGVDMRDTYDVTWGRWSPAMSNMLNWSNPDYESDPQPDLSSLPAYGGPASETERSGVFAQNYVNLTDDFIISVGVRRDSMERTRADAVQDMNNTSTQFGATYNISSDLTAYVSYSESFSPSSAQDKNFDYLPPEQGEGVELGLKGENAALDLTFNVALFDITKNNVAQTDTTVGPDDPNQFASVAIGEQTASGAEIDVTWQPSDALTIFANAGVVDNEQFEIDANGSKVGIGQTMGAADKTASVWASYTVLNEGDLSVSIGGGAEYIGERFITQSLTLDNYTLLNAFVRVNKGDWQAQLNVSNLTDERYVASTWGNLGRGNQPGAPRLVVATLSYSF
jgi:iron complex outermembrane receptor protein